MAGYGIPGWALGLGAVLKAPEVANDYMGLFKNIQSMRDESNTGDALQRINQFKTPEEAYAYQPDGYISPTSRQALEKLRADKLDVLLRQGAAAPLAKVRDLQMDPRFQDQASVEEINKNPTEAVFGQNVPAVGGYVPGREKGNITAAPGVNPYVAQGINEYQQGMQNKLDRFRAAGGDRWAGAGMGKEEANAFKDVATGQKDYRKMDQDSAEQDLNQFIANNEMPRTIEGWNAFWDKARKIPNLPAKLLTEQQAAMQSRNQSPVGAPLTSFVQNGPNSTRSQVSVDMFGEPIAATRTTSTNNPSDREQGLTGDGGHGGTLDVSWIGPDGTPQSAAVPRGELATLKSSLKAQGVKEISTVDGKRASRTETLIPKEKGRRGLTLAGGAAPAAAGPDIETARRLVAKYGSAEAARAAYAKGER